MEEERSSSCFVRRRRHPRYPSSGLANGDHMALSTSRQPSSGSTKSVALVNVSAAFNKGLEKCWSVCVWFVVPKLTLGDTHFALKMLISSRLQTADRAAVIPDRSDQIRASVGSSPGVDPCRKYAASTASYQFTALSTTLMHQ